MGEGVDITTVLYETSVTEVIQTRSECPRPKSGKNTDLKQAKLANI